MLKIVSVLLILAAFVSSCSTPRPQGATEAEVLFKEANRLKEKGRYLLAIERLNTIRSKYPYSYYSTHAELLNADILFEQENYAEAAAAYIVFRDFHPKHKERSYVLYRVAESFYYQLPDTFDRDLSPGYFKTDVYDAAKFRYKLILDNFSDSELRQHSISRLLQSTAKLGELKICKNYYSKFKAEANDNTVEEMDSALDQCKTQKSINDSKEEES